MTPAQCIQRYDDLVAVQKHLQQELKQIEEDILIADKAYLYAVQAREVIGIVGMMTQKNLEKRLSTIVTTALAAVFPDPYEFAVKFVERRNQTEADLILVKNGEECSPLDAVGGGVLDVVAFALRVSALLMQNKRKVIVLDEPFKHLSANFQPQAAAMLKELSTQLHIQFIIVSHEEGIIDGADKVFIINNGKLVEE